jgi:hypothetical protein
MRLVRTAGATRGLPGRRLSGTPPNGKREPSDSSDQRGWQRPFVPDAFTFLKDLE